MAHKWMRALRQGETAVFQMGRCFFFFNPALEGQQVKVAGGWCSKFNFCFFFMLFFGFLSQLLAKTAGVRRVLF